MTVTRVITATGAVVHTETDACPVCGNRDMETWADDGRASRADWWTCRSCNITGAFTNQAPFTHTPNGRPIVLANARLESDSLSFYELVEDAWYELMKGELAIGPGWTSEADEDLRRFVTTLANHGRQVVGLVAAEQYDEQGLTLGYVTNSEMARRVARCIQILSYGGR